MAKICLTLVALSSLAYAIPTPADIFGKRDSIFALTSSQVTYFEPFTYYAGAAYCQPNATIKWDCGGESQLLAIVLGTILKGKLYVLANCEAHQGFRPTAAGGDGDGTQFCESDKLLAGICAYSFHRVRWL